MGPWRLLSYVREGGNAVVWRASATDGREIALKVLKLPEGSERYDRFAQEVRVHLEVLRNRTGVLPLLDAHVPVGVRIDEPPWLAMPLAIPLAEHLGTRPSPSAVVEAGAVIARTLAELLEQHGVSHRDIKPDNLYWYGGPVVGDFGLVATPLSSGITRDDRDLGPRDFLAPEMRAGSPYREGPPADVFSLGLTLFFFVAGTAPRDGLRADEPSHSLATLLERRDLALIDRVLQGATSYRPEHRPTMAAFAGDLEAWLEPPSARRGAPLDLDRVRSRLSALAPVVEEPSGLDAAGSELQQRLHEASRVTFDNLNSLGLESASAKCRLFERIIGEDARFGWSGSSLTLQPRGAGGAVWIGAGTGHSWGPSRRMKVFAGWCVAAHDRRPEVVWSETTEIDPMSVAGLRKAERLATSWADHASDALARFVEAAERFHVRPPEDRSGEDQAAPELLDLDWSVRALPESAAEIVLAVHLTDDVAGVAGVEYQSSPSQARIEGPSGEERAIVFHGDADRVSGTPWNGWYEGTLLLKAFDSRGVWAVQTLMLVDNAGHSSVLSRDDVVNRGFAVDVSVE